jgi:LCP family protein required for cell wall assembly
MTRRAWWLIGLNFLLPGSAQIVAGNRRLGRIGIVSTLVLLGLVLLGVVLWLLAPTSVYAIATHVVALTVLQVVLLAYAVLWVVLTLNTLVLVRLIKALPQRRIALVAFAVVPLLVFSGGASYGAYLASVQRTLIGDVFAGGEMADPVNGRYNIMLLGGDAGPDRMGLRPDSISVISIEAGTGEISSIGIPRNLYRVPFAEGSPLWNEYPNGYNCGDDCLINALYTYGEEHPDLYPEALSADSSPGIEAMRDAVSGVTGLTIQYYALIDMQGFVELIDALGGIDIESTGRYPFGGGVDSNGQPTGVERWVEPGWQHMDGITALWYARARHGTSDYDRMQRQRQVQQAILQQVDPINVVTKFEDIAVAGAQVVSTDIPQGMLPTFVDLALKAKDREFTTLELTPPTVPDVVHPDFEEIRGLVAEVTAPTE